MQLHNAPYVSGPHNPAAPCMLPAQGLLSADRVCGLEALQSLSKLLAVHKGLVLILDMAVPVKRWVGHTKKAGRWHGPGFLQGGLVGQNSVVQVPVACDVDLHMPDICLSLQFGIKDLEHFMDTADSVS